MWFIRQTIRAAAIGEDGVQRTQPPRNLPQSLAVTDFLTEAANPQ
jgi:hypothetical protein